MPDQEGLPTDACNGWHPVVVHYQKGGSVEGSIDSFVRYEWDRTFPMLQGWFTDTSLPASPSWVDLHFGSRTWLSVLAAEARRGRRSRRR